MFSFENAVLGQVMMHRVGNKASDGDLVLSDAPLQLDSPTLDALRRYFLSSFSVAEYYHFAHDVEIAMNPVHQCVGRIFASPDGALVEQSRNLATLLFGCCGHPKIKDGDLYVGIVEGAELDGIHVRALAIVKCENPDTFLEVGSGSDFGVHAKIGINIHRLDKAAIVFDTDSGDGYKLVVIDNTNRGSDALYWVQDFLGVVPCQDEYFQTASVMEMAKTFVNKELPKSFEVDRAAQAQILARGEAYFKGRDTFDMESFGSEVFGQEDVQEAFGQFRDGWQQERGVQIPESFGLDEGAVKREGRAYRSVIKLDKNFHIYVHGGEGLIERGYDPASGKHFYKVYFDEEH